jgi:integrase/recombinase XerC
VLLEALITPFIDHLQFEKRSSPHTIRGYQDDLVQFFDFMALDYGEASLPAITPAVVRSWLASLKDGGMSSRSINRKISTLKSYFKYQIRCGAVEQSPMAAITSPKSGKRLPVYVEQDDMAVLFRQLEFPDTWEGWTDRLLLAIFYHTGIRLSELIQLRERQVDKGNRCIKVLGKGNKERVIPVGAWLMGEIEAYVEKKKLQAASYKLRGGGDELRAASDELRDELQAASYKLQERGVDREYLLVGNKGMKLYPKYAYRAVRKYLAQVTTIRQKSPHVLRHSFATHLVNSGADLNSVKELLGHASLAATQVYTHNTIEKLKEVYRQAHPKA